MLRGIQALDRQGIWKGAGWGLATMYLIDGISYILFDKQVAIGPSFSLIEKMPGGVRVPGVLMVAIAIGLLLTVHNRSSAAQGWLFGVFILSTALGCYTIGGWIISQQVVVTTFSKWLCTAWISLWLAMTTKRGPHASC